MVFSGDEAKTDVFDRTRPWTSAKLAVPNDILNKPGPLDVQERENHQAAPVFFRNGFSSESRDSKQISRWIGTHHETLDGEGFPFQLTENEIELGSRILAIADIFSALVEGPSPIA